ncbi:DNA helicase MCM8 [Culex pipiens pallens]|uniref:DNA helicase MCM8 n=1 Tax=Culex pipiens pallens TaxID=42434 RepID=UPI0019531B92|nr:DNA helicase MCM8 [Culex pipiens pallens]
MDPPVPSSSRGRGGSTARGTSRGKSSWRGRGFWRGPSRGAGSSREKPVGYVVADGGESQRLQPIDSIMVERETCEYPGWKLYLPEEEYRAGSAIVGKVQAMEAFLGRGEYDWGEVRYHCSFHFELGEVEKDGGLGRDWPSFLEELTNSPERTLAIVGLAMHQTVTKRTVKEEGGVGMREDNPLRPIRARVLGYGPEVHLRYLNINNWQKLIAVRGTITRAEGSIIISTWLTFRCSLCHGLQVIRQPTGAYTVPTSCRKGCKARSNFVAERWSPYTRNEPFQKVRLQESNMGARSEQGQVPRSIEVEFGHELVDAVCPGDDVTVTGVVMCRSQEENSARANSSATMYKTYLKAVAVRSNKNAKPGWHRGEEFTELDLEAVNAIRAEPSVFRLMVQSLCPMIHGHEMIKAGLLLGIFGGSAIAGGRRSEIHVLVVGDPGIGKSQILQACARVSPRGIFVCGNSTTNAGLTVNVRSEKGTGATLEAGALVLADQGVCCIDEFDKMSANNQVLLEAMEQQVISVTKAGVMCTMPARTSILAAANPAGGSYDRSKTVSENIRMKPALLSRFDLVFTQLDQNDVQLDWMYTKHMDLRGNLGAQGGAALQALLTNGHLSSQPQSSQAPPLHQSLKLRPGEKMDTLPEELMQKYIAFTRKNINPRLSREAAQELRSFYGEIRRAQQGMHCFPVTTRQIEALIRLTQARARMDLAAEATIGHALDVIAILRFSMVDVFSNDAGDLQPLRMMNGTGTSQTSQVRRLVRALQTQVQATKKFLFSVAELQAIAGGGGPDFNALLDTMNIQGFLLKTGKGLYRFTAD